MPGQDQIELELATKEKEVEESERNLMNYEQTLIVRIDVVMMSQCQYQSINQILNP